MTEEEKKKIVACAVERRKRLGISQRAMAKMLTYGHASLSRLELGERLYDDKIDNYVAVLDKLEGKKGAEPPVPHFSLFKERRLALGWSSYEMARRSKTAQCTVLRVEHGKSSRGNSRIKINAALMRGEWAMRERQELVPTPRSILEPTHMPTMAETIAFMREMKELLLLIKEVTALTK
jgi:transcriptional regulator with XRE-family HTH domain